jgi:hypothetical protein
MSSAMEALVEEQTWTDRPSSPNCPSTQMTPGSRSRRSMNLNFGYLFSRQSQIQTKEYCFPLPAATSPFTTLAAYKRHTADANEYRSAECDRVAWVA